MTKIFRTVLIEDQTAIRELLGAILTRNPQYQIVGQSADGHAGLALVRQLRPDLLVLDATLPGLNGLELLQHLKARTEFRHLRVIIFSGNHDAQLVRDLIQAGAHGFIEKTASMAELLEGVDAVVHGRTYFGPSIAALLRQVVVHLDDLPIRESLSLRHREILKLVAEGFSTKQIGSRLNLSESTVDNHRSSLMRKLNIHGRVAITRYAIDLGLIPPSAGFCCLAT